MTLTQKEEAILNSIRVPSDDDSSNPDNGFKPIPKQGCEEIRKLMDEIFRQEKYSGKN